MDRRDFLKLFTITAAGLYIPKTTYFFMPRMHTIQIPVYTGDAVYVHDGAPFPFQPKFASLILRDDEYRILKQRLLLTGRCTRNDILKDLMIERNAD